MTDGGIMTEHLSELVDLFPTLAEAAGLPKIPVCPEHDPYSVSVRWGTVRGGLQMEAS